MIRKEEGKTGYRVRVDIEPKDKKKSEEKGNDDKKVKTKRRCERGQNIVLVTQCCQIIPVYECGSPT